MKLPKLLLSLAALGVTGAAQTPRSLCLFFDLNSMTAAEQTRAEGSAIQFVQEQMTASDVVSVMTSNPDVKVVEDFTSDRDTLVAALRRMVPGPGADSTGAASADQRLQALESASKMLAPLAGKKAMIYFSTDTFPGGANQEQMKAAVDAAVRANLAIYPVDARTVGADSLFPR